MAAVICDSEVWSSIRISSVLDECKVCSTIVIPYVLYLCDVFLLMCNMVEKS